MSEDKAGVASLSSDNDASKTTHFKKNKSAMMSVEDCIERLQQISGMTKDIEITRWLGSGDSTLANWRRRNTITLEPLVVGLLNHNISLDWFFAPYEPLYYPEPGQYLDLSELRRDYEKSKTVKETVRAMHRIEPILSEFKVPFTEQYRTLMVETFMMQRRDVVTLTSALRQVAKALAVAEQKRNSG